MDYEMSEISAENQQGAESVPDTSGGTSKPIGPSIFLQMQENVNKMTELVAELQQEKFKVEQQKLAMGGHSNNQDVIKKDRLLQLKGLILKIYQINKERDKILQQVQEEMCNYATIQSKLQEHELSMELTVKELQQQKIDLEKEQEDLKEELAVKETAGIDEVKQLDEEIADVGKELTDLNDRVTKMALATVCPVCLVPWGPDGSHRVVTTSCGHLFGSNCLRECIEIMGRCPICGKRARQSDVRNIYYGALP